MRRGVKNQLRGKEGMKGGGDARVRKEEEEEANVKGKRCWKKEKGTVYLSVKVW